MQIDLDAEDVHLDALPRFQRASQQASRLLRAVIGLASLALLGLLAALLIGLFAPHSVWPVLLVNNTAALLLLVAGLQSAHWNACWRARALASSAPAVDPEQPSGGYERLLKYLSASIARLLLQIGLPTLYLAGWALVALLSIRQTWNLDLPGGALGQTGSLVAGISLLCAFALLVLERHLAQQQPAEWPEALPLAQLTRVVIIGLLLSAACLLFSSDDTLWPARLALLTGVLPALVAAELLLRALLSLFSPRRERIEPRLLASSVLASMLRWPPQPLQSLQYELHQRFGIDLRQVWAFTYMRRAFLPLLTLLLGLAWLLSGVGQIALQERGIYERFGEPVAVLGPGLHVGLPWPLGRLLSVENGVVHELATSVAEVADNRSPPPLEPAETPLPLSANRLWDASHSNERSQVIASSAADKQSFQVVNMDVRLVYRIGLTDKAALAATYNSADVPTLIRSTANRVLVHDFAGRTLDGLLGAQRAALAADIGRAVQADLEQLDTGVEILATVVEAIHPPAGAANAYHGVQAAQISAQALIARERGAASEQTNQAQLAASVAKDQAQAEAWAVKATAQVADQRFSAERQAYAQAGQAFVLEQYLSQLGLGLAHRNLLMLDHRIDAASAPTIDLRSFTFAADSAAPRKAVQ
jgi:regulator of protease activity HflC (stomatin/prohibitin superfamily)